MTKTRISDIAWGAAAALCAALLIWSNLTLKLNVGNIIGTLLFGGLFCAVLFRKRLAALVKRLWGHFPGKAAVVAVCLLVLFFAGTSVFFSVNMAYYAERPAERTECVLVLGCQVVGENPSQMLTDRLDAALELLEAEPKAVCIVSGGKGANESVSEAEAMRRYLAERGVPEERIIMEDGSFSTAENFRNSAEILRGLGIESNITVVTSDFHQYRAHIYAEREGLSVSHHSARTGVRVFLNHIIREYCALAAAFAGY